MSERVLTPTNYEPQFQNFEGVVKLNWNLDGKDIELCMSVSKSRKELADHSSLISRLNGSHPLKIVELEDAYCAISASEKIEVYDSPQKSDSQTSKMRYLAREMEKPRRVFVQDAPYGVLASIHEHEEGEDVWERYDWVRGKMGLRLPNNRFKTVDEKTPRVIIPGKLKHQAEGLSHQSSITIITTTAKEHIHSNSF